MMCASRMSGTHRIIATKGSSIIFAQRQKHHLPDRATSFILGVWHTNVLLAGVCDKKPAEIRILLLTSASFYKLSLRVPLVIDIFLFSAAKMRRPR